MIEQSVIYGGSIKPVGGGILKTQAYWQEATKTKWIIVKTDDNVKYLNTNESINNLPIIR